MTIYFDSQIENLTKPFDEDKAMKNPEISKALIREEAKNNPAYELARALGRYTQGCPDDGTYAYNYWRWLNGKDSLSFPTKKYGEVIIDITCITPFLSDGVTLNPRWHATVAFWGLINAAHNFPESGVLDREPITTCFRFTNKAMRAWLSAS